MTSVRSLLALLSAGGLFLAPTLAGDFALASAANSPPIAQDDAAPVSEAGSSAIEVLANDSDTDGTLVPGSVTIVQQGAGSVTPEPVTGEAIYTPAPGFLGDDSFTYTVADDLGATSNVATVTVRVLPAPSPGETVVVAAGDIACVPGAVTTPSKCRHAQTAQLAETLDPAAVLVLGDLQYNSGELANFLASYDPTWGALKSKTFPSAGNHEYGTPGAAGYFDYWGAQAGPAGVGYYSFDLAGWHVIALNTQCSGVPGGCGPGSPQAVWLEADLAQHGSSCTITFGHYPRWASGGSANGHGDHPELQELWRLMSGAGVDIYLAGHNHNLQRFEPLNVNGAPDPDGIREFIVGTGGRNIIQVPNGGLKPEVESYVPTFGVLRLSLGAGAYSWSFVTEPGDPQTDSGTAGCTDGATNSPPDAIDDVAVTTVDTTVSIDVLGNDADPDSDPLAVTALDTTGTLGSLVDNGDGTVDYTPPTGFSGEDSFGYTAADPGGLSDSALVTVSVGGTALTFAPSDDASVKVGSPTGRYGSASSLEVDAGSDKDLLLRFDVSGIGTASVASATLRLYNTNPSSFGGEFHIVTDTAWNEGTVTWGNAPAGDGGLLGSLGAVTAGTWYELDVTPLVTGDGVVSLRARSPNTNGANYASKEHPNGFAPELVIEFA